jgi:hypothetical protein
VSCLLNFCAHKAGYGVLIKRWHNQDFTEHLSVVRHPGEELYKYLRESLTRLKREQGEEIKATQGRGKHQAGQDSLVLGIYDNLLYGFKGVPPARRA